MKSFFLAAIVCSGIAMLRAQSTDFVIEGRPVQIHGFGSQAFAASDGNNFLTMHTDGGSFSFTDFGANISVKITDKLRVGAQFYDRDIGELGKWHPQLDWASADYRFTDWFGIRAGKIKTVLGLYNDTQDQESLHTWAILPQSIYPLDLRATNIAHVGGDLYGDIPLKRLGTLSYTAYAGLVPNDRYGGYAYGSEAYGVNLITLGARSEGADLRWSPPVRGLLAGLSYVDSDSEGRGIDPGGIPFNEHSKKSETSQFYLQYVHGGLTLDGEYRRAYLDDVSLNPYSFLETVLDSRSFYGSVSYRISKRVEIGSYYSRFYLNWGNPLSDPMNHIFDKVATARLDLTSHWEVKVEGHFMNGYGASHAFQGFYLQNNPQGYKPDTNLLIIRTGIEF